MVPTSWDRVTVRQYQELSKLYTEIGHSNLDLIVLSASILTGKPESYYDSLPMSKVNEIGKMLSFTHVPIKPKPARYIDVNSKRYRCIYDIRRMPNARYIETKVFTGSGTINDKLHLIGASMVMPQKRWFKFAPWYDDTYSADKHPDYAQDILDAPITSVLGSIVFFCEVYLKSTWSLKHYLVKEMTTKTKMTEAMADETVMNLCNTMDGIMPSEWLLTTKV